jgi:hypothetical protein
MSPDPTVSAVLSDLREMRAWCSRTHKNPPPAAVAYLVANRKLLLCLIDAVSAIPIADRRDTCRQHRELDETIIAGDLSIARSAADKASSDGVRSGLAKMNDDDINMIIRPIEYLKYFPLGECPDDTALSPVQLPP